jgi:hypothetical protein
MKTKVTSIAAAVAVNVILKKMNLGKNFNQLSRSELMVRFFKCFKLTHRLSYLFVSCRS